VSIIAFVQCNRCLVTLRATSVTQARIEAHNLGWRTTGQRGTHRDYCPDCQPHIPQLRRKP
jgi:hypothetical protein